MLIVYVKLSKSKPPCYSFEHTSKRNELEIKQCPYLSNFALNLKKDITLKQWVNSYEPCCVEDRLKECKHKYKQSEDEAPSSNKQRPWGIKRNTWRMWSDSTHAINSALPVVGQERQLAQQILHSLRTCRLQDQVVWESLSEKYCGQGF